MSFADNTGLLGPFSIVPLDPAAANNPLHLIFAITDQNGTVAFALDSTGHVAVPGNLPPDTALASGNDFVLTGDIYTAKIFPLGTNQLNLLWAFTDQNGAVAFGMDTSGNIIGPPMLPTNTVISGNDIFLQGELWTPTKQGLPSGNNYVFAITDSNQNLAFGVRADGSVDIGYLNNANAMTALADTNGAKYYTAIDALGKSNIYKIDGGTGNLYQLTAAGTGNNTNPNLSATGRHIYFMTDRDGGIPKAYYMDLFGRNQLPVGTDPIESYTLNGIMVYGQSLSVGVVGAPGITTSQPYSNLMFSSGIVSGDGSSNGAYAPLIPATEAVAVDNAQTSSSGTLETGWASAVNFMTYLLMGEGYYTQSLISAAGRGGTSITTLNNGTDYNRFINQANSQHSLALAAGYSHRYRAVFYDQGETDINASNYYSLLVALQAQMQNTLKGVSGQSEDIPMLLSQSSTWMSTQVPYPSLADLQASEDDPKHFLLVGPQYQYPHLGQHMPNDGYRWQGQQFGKVLSQLMRGVFWRPVSPRRIRRNGNKLVIQFWVPVQPLVIDTSSVSAPATTGGMYGFEYWDNSGSPPAITNVQVVSPTSVMITLASAPSGSGNRIRYAYTSPTNDYSSNPRGNLRDSDATVSLYNNSSTGQPYPLYNWCCHFDKAC